MLELEALTFYGYISTAFPTLDRCYVSLPRTDRLPSLFHPPYRQCRDSEAGERRHGRVGPRIRKRPEAEGAAVVAHSCHARGSADLESTDVDRTRPHHPRRFRNLLEPR